MQKSVSSLKWAALAALGAMGLFTASSARASLVTFDLEATGISGAGTVVDLHNVVGAAAGDQISLNVYAVLHGATNASTDGTIQFVGNINSSNGGLLGNVGGTTVNSSFHGTGFQAGTQVDSDNDTDLGIGSEATYGQGASDAVTGNTYFAAVSPGALTLAPVTGTPDASNDLKQLLGTAVFTVTGSGGSTTLTWFPHLKTDGLASAKNDQRFVEGGTTFQLNGTAGGTPTNFDFSTVNVTAAPEPGSLALAGIGAAGLLLRRRRK